VAARFWPFSIPAYSSSKQTFWFLFHQNRSRITRVLVGTNFWCNLKGTRHGLIVTTPNRLQRFLEPPKTWKNLFWNKFELYFCLEAVFYTEFRKGNHASVLCNNASVWNLAQTLQEIKFFNKFLHKFVFWGLNKIIY